MQTNLKKNKTFFDRVLQIIDYKKIKSVNEFALNYLNYDAPQKINRLKKENSKPSYDILLDIVNKFEEINPKWLLTGKGEMLRQDTPCQSSQHHIIDIEGGKLNTLLACTKACAGFGSFLDEPERLSELPAMALPNAPLGLNVAFQIAGDSMFPTINHMDYVAGNKLNSINEIQENLVHIVVDKELGVLCKRVQVCPKGFKLISDNPQHKVIYRKHDYILGFFKAFMKLSENFIRSDIFDRMDKLQTSVSRLETTLTKQIVHKKPKNTHFKELETSDSN